MSGAGLVGDTGGSRKALAGLCLCGAAIAAATAAAPVSWNRYGNEGIIPVLIGSGILTFMAARIATEASAKLALPLIIVVAVVVRLLALLHEPVFSTDIYRYIWDGRVQAAGINPYSYVPADPALASLRDETIFPHINRADYARTAYPPAAELFFLIVTRFGESVGAMRVALVVCEALTFAIVLDLLRRLRKPSPAIVAFAWHPLAIWEITNNGHVEALMVTLLMAALWLAVSARAIASGIVLGLATLVKPYAAAALPALTRRDWRLTAAFAATVVVCYVPYLGVGKAVLGYVGSGYLSEEGFSAGNGFWTVLALRRAFGEHALILPLYLALAAAVLAWLSYRAFSRSEGTPRELIERTAVLLMAGLFFLSPNYPWYFLVLVPLLPLVSTRVAAPAWVMSIGAFLLNPLWPDGYDAHYLLWKGMLSIACLIAAAWALSRGSAEPEPRRSAWAR